MAAVADARERQLAWEARQRPRAGIAAIAAGVLTLAGTVWWLVVVRDNPAPGFLESLGQVAEPGPIGEQPSLRISGFEYFVDNSIALVGSFVVRAVALLALGWAVTFLAAATRARRPEFARAVVYLTLVGAVLSALSDVLLPIGLLTEFNAFLDGPRTVDEARDVGGSLLVTAQLLTYVGPFIVAAGLLLVSLNAMRVGLLTRFLGILGVISGVLTVLPQLMPLPIVVSFWLVTLGLMLLGTGRAGLPPAWRSGKAEPWPPSQRGRRRAAPQEPPEPAEPAPAARPHPSSRKRKRKSRH